PILSRSRLRRSTYGSLRYTNTTHVMANKSTIATPALAIPPRLRTSRPSLNHSSSARTGSAPSVSRGTTYRKYSPTGVSSSRQDWAPAAHRRRDERVDTPPKRTPHENNEEQPGDDQEREGDLGRLEEDLAELGGPSLQLQARRHRHHHFGDRDDELHQVNEETV